MKKMIEGRSVEWLKAEVLNTAYAEGYRFMCDGDYAITDGTDPWSGMPNTTQNAYFFDSGEEAEAFAIKQIWVFNSDIHADVYKIPEHTETRAEREAREAKEKAEKEARKLARDTAKAEAEGMSVEAWRERQKELAKARRYRREAENMKAEIERLKAEIEWRERRATEIETKK